LSRPYVLHDAAMIRRSTGGARTRREHDDGGRAERQGGRAGVDAGSPSTRMPRSIVANGAMKYPSAVSRTRSLATAHT
jgi:hypothetical protein